MIKKAVEMFQGKGKILIVMMLLMIGVLLLTIGFSDGTKGADEGESFEPTEVDYAQTTEGKIKEFLETVHGIEQVNVFVTVDGGFENEYAKKGDSGYYASDYLLTNSDGDTEAAIVRTIYPRIRGVAISCTGGDNAEIKEKVTTLISAGLGIGTNKIEVVGI